jgi:hypothetical protein
VLLSATSSGHTTSKRSNTVRIWSSNSNLHAPLAGPPLSCAVSFALIPSERLIDLRQRLDRHLNGSPDEPWTPFAIEFMTESPGEGYWQRSRQKREVGSVPISQAFAKR